MIYKITYQETSIQNPKREDTKALYIEAENDIEARLTVERNTPYNIEFVQPVEGKHLAYEQKSENFVITEFPQ